MSEEQIPGKRKDGKPYKEDNTREDGSYKSGKYRPPAEHQFRKGDGRPRGKREKGSKNVSTDWEQALRKKRTLGGETMTTRRLLIEALIIRGIKSSDRAAEKALEQAARLEQSKEKRISRNDDEIIAAWLADMIGEEPVTTDDADTLLPESEENGDEEADDASH